MVSGRESWESSLQPVLSESDADPERTASGELQYAGRVRTAVGH